MQRPNCSAFEVVLVCIRDSYSTTYIFRYKHTGVISQGRYPTTACLDSVCFMYIYADDFSPFIELIQIALSYRHWHFICIHERKKHLQVLVISLLCAVNHPHSEWRAAVYCVTNMTRELLWASAFLTVTDSVQGHKTVNSCVDARKILVVCCFFFLLIVTLEKIWIRKWD
jgi:hypothetical protein